ncbi:hypothetical protein CBR_g30325 [Chara braunii]|uniref:DUF6816 domain-containing protein n=1 Tax=Chara braunii TaxID=69332 RepID=A0A388JX33_CHABU|nr:hypothetical protein CBR_g30325 [Chara braunii]|eukprot:GBG62371.1 hypothetical protein CBR_g30325 [Chara braunii]
MRCAVAILVRQLQLLNLGLQGIQLFAEGGWRSEGADVAEHCNDVVDALLQLAGRGCIAGLASLRSWCNLLQVLHTGIKCPCCILMLSLVVPDGPLHIRQLGLQVVTSVNQPSHEFGHEFPVLLFRCRVVVPFRWFKVPILESFDAGGFMPLQQILGFLSACLGICVCFGLKPLLQPVGGQPRVPAGAVPQLRSVRAESGTAGEEMADLPSVRYAQKQLGYTVTYQARFIPYRDHVIGDRLFTSIVENLVTKRSFAMAGPGRFDTSEFSRQVFDSSAVKDGPPSIKAIQRIAMFAVPGGSSGPNGLSTIDVLAMAGKPTTVYKYTVRLRRASQSLRVAAAPGAATHS